MICALILPLANVALWTGGTATYTDFDVIRYDRPVPALVVELVENRRGTDPRVECAS